MRSEIYTSRLQDADYYDVMVVTMCVLYFKMLFMPPTTKMGGAYRFAFVRRVRPSVCPSVRLSVRPSVRLSVRPSVRTSV